MMRSFFGRLLGRELKARPRQLRPSVDGLETRALLTGGSVTLSGGLVTVLPNTAASQNTVVVQYQKVGSKTMLDVQLNGVNHDFALGSIGTVYFNGTGTASNETITNKTGVYMAAYGGSGNNVFTGGSGADTFVGGSGKNTFNAGTGFDTLSGGTGTNVFNESATGSGIIFKDASTDTIHRPSGATGHYYVY